MPNKLLGPVVGVVVVALFGATTDARADVLDDLAGAETADLVKTFAKRALKRFRRSTTLGPMVGYTAGATLDGGDFESQISFGLGLLRYDIPVLPDPSRIKEILKERAIALVKERVKAAALRGEEPTEAMLEQWARDSWEAVKAELLHELRPRRFEKPKYNIRIEGNYGTESEAWAVRFLLGIGIGPVYLNVGQGLQVEDGAAGLFTVELSKPMLLTDGLNSPVLEFVVRLDVPENDRGDRPDVLLAGLRFYLDII